MGKNSSGNMCGYSVWYTFPEAPMTNALHRGQVGGDDYVAWSFFLGGGALEGGSQCVSRE